VRDPDEYRDGSIEAANNISRGFLEFRIGSVASDPSTPLVLYCQTGLRSMLAAKALHDLGYKNVINLQGGFQRWAQSGLPVVKDTPLTSEQIQRYSRHFLLPQVGEKGQRKLLRSKVLLIGAGGLGSPTALYLAAAGVGTLGLMDGDVVDVSNLQRQIVHTTASVGRPKVDSGAETLQALNPDAKIIKLPMRIDVDNVMDIIKDYDLVVDGSDNFDTRYLVTTPATWRARPMSTAPSSSSRAWPRCSLPTRVHATLPLPDAAHRGPRPQLKRGWGPGRAPRRDRGGAGDGSHQAPARDRRALIGRLMTYDALGMRVREVRLRRDPKCPVCGEHPSITDLSIHREGAAAACATDAMVIPRRARWPRRRQEASSEHSATRTRARSRRGAARDGRPGLAILARGLDFDAASGALRFIHGIDLVVH